MYKEYEPDLIFEEIHELLQTGQCPKCGSFVTFTVDEDDWQGKCVNCNTIWGGCI